jgi:group I intron endonuclease
MLNMNFYIYRHIRPDTNEVFYIGKGNTFSKSHSNRAYEKHRRNKWWQNIVSKNNGNYKVEILFECETEDEVNKKEIEFIELYGRKDLGKGTLVNLTNGADGSVGVVVSKETRLKLSKMFSGENHPNFGKKLSKETCNKKSESMKNSNKNLKGKTLPDWWKDKIRQTKMGSDNPMFGEKSHLAKAVVDIETGIEYHSIMDAAKSTQYQFQYISAMLNNKKPNKTNLRYKDGL